MPSCGGRGIGRALLHAALRWARRSGHEQMTLITFRALPWNMPFYASAGFEELARSEWSAELAAKVREESTKGLLPEARVVMSTQLSNGKRSPITGVR